MDFPDARGPNGLKIVGTIVFGAGGQDDSHDLVFVDGHLFVTAQTSHSLVVVRFKSDR